MSSYSHLFDASSPDTPDGLTATLVVQPEDLVPSLGSGLTGFVYVPDTSITSIAGLFDIIATRDPDLTFVASEIAYSGKSSSTTVAQFLGEDSASLSGNGEAFEMGPSGIALSGYVYIPAGVHEIKIVSDDGFAMNLGGTPFMSFEGTRAADETTRVADFEGGLYELDLVYFDAWGVQSLRMEIDGLPVDQSAFYQSVDDFLSPDPEAVMLSAAEYHPSYMLGEESLETEVDGTGTAGHDQIAGQGADDVLLGLAGDDSLNGGYGDDILEGGDGNDVLDGGRGSDILIGGDGDDLLIARSDAGITRIGQLAVGTPTRDDPDGEVNDALQILKGYEYQPLVGDDVLIGGAGSDTFLISPQINAKLEIIQEHVRSDGTINWAGVAGENAELHDHWVDSFGIDIIADYNAAEDHIAVIGHTANVYVEHADVIGDAALESIITVISNQHGGGGAHDMDLIGQVIVHGDLVQKEDITTDNMVTYGIVDTYDEVAEAILPNGETKQTLIDGVVVHGYDTRGPDGDLGPITADPARYFDNANFNEDMLDSPVHDIGPELTRDPFEPLETVGAAGQSIEGTNGRDHLSPELPGEPAGLPGALGYWSLGGASDGAFADLTGRAPDVTAYRFHENQALVRSDATTQGPDGAPDGAMYFNGEDDFAFLQHHDGYEVSQGTITLWVRPDDLGETSMFLSKDQSGRGDGGHFRLGHTDKGGLFLRMAEGDGGSNHAWTTGPILSEGEWQHLAVSFSEGGVTVYLDGAPVPNRLWQAVEGDVSRPGGYTEAYFLQNEEPWVLGADQAHTRDNDTALEYATSHGDLPKEFEGGLAGFGLWGGMEASDVLDQAQIQQLIAEGPGDALTNPVGPVALLASDDVIEGLGGDDLLEGLAGNDALNGGTGRDTLLGGYGDDLLEGGAGNDRLDGGRGSDLLFGGSGDDVLISRSDVGEQRIGQLVLDDPSRDFPDPSVDPTYLKLVDWIDQPLVGDDVLVGGDGADHFLFETLINGKADIILEHVNDDRTIDWMGVAGENARLHDHWVDAFGIDVVADYVAGEDKISVIGHTTRVAVDHRTIDTDGDGIDDDAVSIITAYSQQGNGGAHDEDLIGYIVVHGDRVEEEDITIDPKAAYGVVESVDELQEAVAPSGAMRVGEYFGYDTRDIAGDPIGSDPGAFSENPWLMGGHVDLASATSSIVAPGLVASDAGGSFDGSTSKTIGHDDAMLLRQGTIAFTFIANDPGNGENQALFSKDHSGMEEGGHVTAWISDSGYLKLRFQDRSESHYLVHSSEKIVAGQDYSVAFTFDAKSTSLLVNGAVVDTDHGFYGGGMDENAEDIVLGASTHARRGDDDRLDWHLDGEVANLLILDRPLQPVEADLLANGGGEWSALSALDYAEAPAEPEPDGGNGGDDNFISKFINMILKLFGLGGRDAPPETMSESEALGAFEFALLSDIVPDVEESEVVDDSSEEVTPDLAA